MADGAFPRFVLHVLVTIHMFAKLVFVVNMIATVPAFDSPNVTVCKIVTCLNYPSYMDMYVLLISCHGLERELRKQKEF